MLSVGAVLQGRYRIETILGYGGMGSVYLATHLTLGRQVAIKQLYVRSNDAVVDSAALRQFQNEAQILQSLSHPRLPAVYDYVENDGSPYLIMEYVKGRSLGSVLENEEEPLPLPQILDWANSLCDVLEYLHEHNPPVIFRDLKPSNVMLDVDGQIRLIDFGISKVIVAGGVTHTFARGAGSPGYSAPEQYSLSTDARSDIYSFGATLYSLLTGKSPPSSVELAAGLVELPPVQEFRAEVSPELAEVVYQCMTLRSSERPRTARLVKEMLAAASLAPPSKPEDRPSPAPAVELQPAYLVTTEKLDAEQSLAVQIKDLLAVQAAPAEHETPPAVQDRTDADPPPSGSALSRFNIAVITLGIALAWTVFVLAFHF